MRSNRATGFRCARAIVLAAGLSLAWTSVAAAQTAVTWTGAGGNTNWSNPLNWSPQVVPMNAGATQYVVTISATATVVIDAAMPAAFAVNSITLPTGATLNATANRVVSLADDSGLRGRVEVQNGASILVALPSGGVPGTLNGTIFSIALGGQFHSAASAYTLVDRGTGVAVTANGTGSLVDMSSVHSLSFGSTAPNNLVVQGIEANRGTVDLSGLTAISRVGTGILTLNAFDGGIIRMPQITAFNFAEISLGGTGQIQTGVLTSIDQSTVTVNAGAQFALTGTLTNYSIDRAARFFSTSGAGSALNLSSLNTITLSTTSPDFVPFEVRADNGVVNLSGLQSVVQNGKVNLNLNAMQNGLINLSSLPILRNASISTQTGGSVIAPNLANIDGTSASVYSGQLVLPGVSSYSSGNVRAGMLVLTASGAGSLIRMQNLATMSLGSSTQFGQGYSISSLASAQIDLPALTSITSVNGGAFGITATDGGTIAMNALLALPATTGNLTVTGANSRIDLPSVTSISQATIPFITVSNGGVLNLSALTVLQNARVSVQDAQLLTGTLASINNSSFSIGFASLIAPTSLTTITLATLPAGQPAFSINHGTIGLAGVQSIAIGGPTVNGLSVPITAGTDGTLDLSSLMSITRVNDARVQLTASGGGRVLMPVLSALPGQTSLTVNGATSLLQLSAVNAISSSGELTLTATNSGVLNLSLLAAAPLVTSWTMSATNGGIIQLPVLNSLGNGPRTFTLQSGGRIELPSIASLTNTALLITDPGSQLVTSTISSLDGSTISVQQGASYASPVTLQSYTSPLTGGNTMFVSGASASLNLGSLRGLTYGDPNSTGPIYNVTAVDGTIDLSGVNVLNPIGNARLALNADVGGRIMMQSLPTINGRFSVAAIAAGSDVDLSGLTSIGASPAATFTSSATGAIIRLNNLATLAGGGLSVGHSFEAANGGQILLPSLSDIATANTVRIVANASTLSLPSLTSLGTGSGRSLQASGGGLLDIPGLSTLGEASNVGLFVNGTASRLSLPLLTSMGSGAGRTISADGTAALIAPGLTQLLNADVTIRNGGQLQTGVLSSIDGSTFLIGDGATFVTPAGLAAYSPLSRGASTIFQSIGTASLLNLSSITSLGFGSASTPAVTHTVVASGNGTVNLSGAASLNRINGGFLGLTAQQGGIINLSGLSTVTDSTISISAGSQLITGPLTSIDGSTASVSGGIAFATPPAIASYSPHDRPSAILFVADGTGSRIDLTSLAFISYGSTGAPGVVHTIRAQNSGVVDLSSLTTLTRVNAGLLGLDAGFGGIIRLPGVSGLEHSAISITGTTAQILTAPLTSIDGSTLFVNSGAQFVLPVAVTAYSPLDLSTRAVFTAMGTGSLLNLGSLHSLQYGSTAASGAIHSIVASGAVVDLSGLTSLSRINQGYLTLQSSTVNGIRLPGITNLSNTNVILSSSGSIMTGTLSSIDGLTLSLSGSTNLTLPATLTSYDAADRGSITLFRTLSGARAELGSLTSVRLGNVATPGIVQTLDAASSSLINLRSVNSIQLMNGARLAILVNSGATVDLSSLTTLNSIDASITSASSRLLLGPVTSALDSSLTLRSGATLNLPQLVSLNTSNRPAGSVLSTGDVNTRLDLPALQSMTVGSAATPNVIHTVTVGSSSVMNLSSLQSITALNGGGVRFNISSATLQLPTVTITPSVSFSIGGTNNVTGLRLTGSLFNHSTNPFDFDATFGSVTFGGGIVGFLEAAGLDLGRFGVTTANFGIGQLRLGENGQPAAIAIVDLYDNSFRGTTGHEALYLFGGTGTGDRNGLILLNGSRLFLDDSVHVYSMVANVMTDLRTLIPTGQTQVAYGGGFLVVPTPGAAGMLLVAGLFAHRRRARGRRASPVVG